MFREEEKDQSSGEKWKSYSRSMSWTERPPRKSNPKSQWNSKARACLPPLQPLSIVRQNPDEWPRAGSDDIGVWPNPPTPRASSGSVTPRENSTSDEPVKEFQFRRDMLSFYSKECSRILDHIYLGSDAIAKNREILRQNGITHVLNCVGFVCPEYFKNELVYKTLWLQDSPSEDITSIMYDVFDYFEDVREQGGRVLVHCCQGVSRSTSLVIAYLMWKEGQSFDDAFQLVKSARGITNPNVGFACQLLQCQRRVHALPPSPTSLIRMYRMAPHSPYDPLHLVPKMLLDPNADKLDSRGAFIIQIPSSLYVWIGKNCAPMMLDNAISAASQIIRYEKAKGPVITINEGEESLEFWDAFSYRKGLAEEFQKITKESKRVVEESCSVSDSTHNRRKVTEYDTDFEIFHGALSGGVVPPFPLSEVESETCLPIRESGWNKLRKTFAKGIIMKELINSSKSKSSALRTQDETMDTCNTEVEDCDSSTNSSMPQDHNDAPESPSSCPGSEASLSRSPSFGLMDSKSKSSSTSPSLSPSTSDYSSSFTFSPSSSNWSDLSFVSAHPSPQGIESNHAETLCKSGPTGQSVTSEGINGNSLSDGTLSSSGDAIGSSDFHSQLRLPSIDEAPQLTRYLEDDSMRDGEHDYLSREPSFEMVDNDPISDAKSCGDHDDEVLCVSQDETKYGSFRLQSDDMSSNLIESSSNLVFYEWPSLRKMNTDRTILDSGSVYMILVSPSSFVTKSCDVLYVWVGRNVSSIGTSSQLDKNNSTCEHGSHLCLEATGRMLLLEEGISTDAQVKVVKEGEEPVHLQKLLASLTLNKGIDSGIK